MTHPYETTLTLDTAWIGEGPTWCETFPTIIAFAITGARAHMISVAEMFDCERFADHWREMMEADECNPTP